MIINDGNYRGQQILKPETVEMMTSNQIPNMPGDAHGLGWEISEGWYMDALADPSAIGHTGYTGTSMVVNQNNNTIAILLTNRVHPSRDTVSTNPARRKFARQVADAIPVTIPAKSDAAWFSGYEDDANRTLTAAVDVTEQTALSFHTWYRMEEGYDTGTIEVSTDGKNWTNAGAAYTGSNSGWEAEHVQIPKGTKFIRFNYQTDTYTNGRGWYISNVKLDGESVDFKSNDWVKRTY